MTKTEIPGLVCIQHSTNYDNRGSFRRSFCKDIFSKNGILFDVVQANISVNLREKTMRGFHYRSGQNEEKKILTPITGAIYNVVIDLRKNSPTFLKRFEIKLDANDHTAIVVPENCANAFLTLTDNTIIQYYMGDTYAPETSKGFAYDDPFFSIRWPYEPETISVKDQSYDLFCPEKL